MQTTSRRWQSLQSVAMVASYVPRRCGIATFTADLSDGIAAVAPEIALSTVAMNDRPEGYRYPQRVSFEVNQHRMGEYRLAAEFLNMSNIDVCCVQHEYGIFGGPAGQHLLEMVRKLRMPVVATLHTVLKEPDKHQREVMRQLAKFCDRFVVMADRAMEFLLDSYDIDRAKVELIPHGIPNVPFVDPNFYKDHFGVEAKKVILTFGLLGPSKGIEVMIEALPRVVAKHPDVIYIVLGATHPGVMAEQGEEYRLGLERRAKELGVTDHVEFVNKYVELDELVEFLGAADVYVTPYLNEAQITSGTLSYAMGSGKATVSTPYWHAQELLAEDRGKLVPFRNPEALAGAINELFDNETERHAMRKRAYQHTRQMCWENVASSYLDLFETVREERNRDPRPTAQYRRLRGKTPELTEIKLDHLRTLTDDIGIYQHAKATVPDRRHGYTTDDNARALIAVLMAADHVNFIPGSTLEQFVNRYLAFLEHAFDDASGRFKHRLHFDRSWRDDTTSEEAHGRAIWGLGEAVARCQTRGHMALAANLFQRALPACETLSHPHGWAYSLIGIHAYLRRFSGDSHARRVREQLAHKLFEQFKANASDDWPWLSDDLTYANARLPHALLLSGRWMFNNEMIQVALRNLEWLHSVQTGEKGQFEPVGTDGWFHRGGEKSRFNQQPIEAAAMIDACLEAYRVTADSVWTDRAHRCLNWFLGDNDLATPLYDAASGGCHDALMAHGVSENQSTESTLAWLLSLLALYDHNLDQVTGTTTREEAAEAVDQAVSAVSDPKPGPAPKSAAKKPAGDEAAVK